MPGGRTLLFCLSLLWGTSFFILVLCPKVGDGIEEKYFATLPPSSEKRILVPQIMLGGCKKGSLVKVWKKKETDRESIRLLISSTDPFFFSPLPFSHARRWERVDGEKIKKETDVGP